MNNIQFWIWLIVIVITLIARARKKKQPVSGGSPERQSGSQTGEDESNKPMTFEDLLREIQASKTTAPKTTSRPVEVVDYDDDIPEEAKSLERTDYSYAQPQRTNEIYEKAKAEAFFRPSLEETMKLQDTIIRFGQFKGYQQDEKVSPAAEFAKEIRNPSGFRKAFILSEILKRRF